VSTFVPVLTRDLAIEIARLGAADERSPVAALRGVAELAARTVPGCAGAAVTRWDGPEQATDWVASQPDVATLMEIQLDRVDGPVFEVARTGAPAFCDDTLIEMRWPDFTAAALAAGVRSAATVPHERPFGQDGGFVTVSVFGALPGAFAPERLSLAALLAAQGGVAMSNVLRNSDAQRASAQFHEAVTTRSVVDQAKGIIMHATGCDADAAFVAMRHISQTRHVKLTAIAARVVAGRGLDPAIVAAVS
jgi:hypothetical protein